MKAFGQTGPQDPTPVMTNGAVEAMVSGAIPLETVIRIIKIATKVDFVFNDQEYAKLVKAGASDGGSDQILAAMQQRVSHGVVGSAPSPGYKVYNQDQNHNTDAKIDTPIVSAPVVPAILTIATPVPVPAATPTPVAKTPTPVPATVPVASIPVPEPILFRQTGENK